MNMLGLLSTLYILGAFLMGAVGAGMLALNSRGAAAPGLPINKGHYWLSPLYLLLLIGIWAWIWENYTDLTYYRPVRADLVGHYESDPEKSDAYLESRVFLTLNADSTYVIHGDLLPPSKGVWAMPNQKLSSFEPALALSNFEKIFYQVVVIRETNEFHLAIQGLDPDDTSVLALKKVK
jgi:hypothetical protein